MLHLDFLIIKGLKNLVSVFKTMVKRLVAWSEQKFGIRGVFQGLVGIEVAIFSFGGIATWTILAVHLFKDVQATSTFISSMIEWLM